MSEKKYNFQKLTPIKNANLNVYEDALNFIFENNDIKNVAISGPYSAGKSSVIETYKINHPEVQCLHISLSHFQSAEEDPGSLTNSNDVNGSRPNSDGESNKDNSAKSDEVILEGKILNQLIHQIDPNKIPQSNFKLKQKVSIKNTILDTGLSISFIVFLAYIISFNSWFIFVSSLTAGWIKNMLLWTLNRDLLLLSGLLCIVILSRAIFTIIWAQKNRNIFKKLNFQGNEIEIFEENDDSYFDKYLNEVLYLFENSEADVIIFEDMDRYHVHQIFEKLREVNTLINNKRTLERNTPLRFFYLLRDDMFVSKDRTKFFDFIIPTVPVVDGSNSYDQFIKHFKQGGIFELFDRDFLQGLSLYIDDMRILKNIYNEFVIYHNRIQSIELSNNKLLAIITYKNIFPKDFGDLQLSLGFVHTLFENKTEHVLKELKNIDNQINEIEDKISLTKDEHLDSLDDLDAIYLLVNHQITRIAGKDVSTYKTRSELIKAIKENPDEVYHYRMHHSNNILDVSYEFDKLSQNQEYKRRKEAIERKTDGQIEKLKVELQNLINRKATIQNSRLRDIITKDNIDKVFSVSYINEIGEEDNFGKIKASPYFPLIKYLVRNGYIDETYSDYMTYFYENSLSRVDKNFLLSVTDQLSKEYSYSLKDPQLVLSRLRPADFDHVEVLNFNLLCYILQTQKSNEKYLKKYLQQLMRTRNFYFIGEFLETQRETNLFVEAVNNFWPDIFHCIISESDFSHEQIKQYAIYTLYYSPEDDIKELNTNNNLSEFISNSSDFLDINQPNMNKLISGFSLVNVRFKWIDFEVSNKELFEAVYNNNLYQIRFDFISLILENVYGLTKNSDFNKKNYTLINSRHDEPLALYVKNSINQYMRTMLDNCDECINDEESAVLALLNNSGIDEDKKEEYISYLQTIIEKIETVKNEELWNVLLQQGLVIYSEDNIVHYFFKFGLDSFLIDFINSKSAELIFNSNSIDSGFGEGATSNFFNAILTCNEISNERYESILEPFNRFYGSFSETNIDEDKVLILIKLNIIRMTGSALIFMRENYPNLLIAFVTHNIKKYTEEVINEENFDMLEMLSVLEEKVDDKYKIKLLQFATTEISLIERSYSVPVKLYILENNLDINDIPFLLSCYPTESDRIKNAIIDISIERIDDIITEQYSIPFELQVELLESNHLPLEMKKELFALSLPNMSEEQVKEILSTLEMNDFLSLFNRKRPTFEINEINKKILTIFKEKQWITKFEVDKNEPNLFRAIGRRINEEQTELL